VTYAQLLSSVTRDGAIVTLREITAETVRAICALETSDAQKEFVSPNAVSIAQAHFHPTARFKAVYADDTPAGFIMWRPAEETDACYLWRFMIDKSQQRHGYGRAALQLWLHDLATQGVRMVRTSYVAGDAGPRDFYRGLGFQDTGELKPSGEWTMTLAL
jgi:diamine N-acetyltransferase